VEQSRNPAERIVGDSLEGAPGIGRPLSRRARQTERSVEAYLRSGVRPRWMERLAEIDLGVAQARRRLERDYEALRRECGSDRARFARRWRALARRRRFDDLNELIRQHNEWFPVERDLPMNPRTGDYVLINGRPYRRRLLGPGWVLEEFPAE
jgi:hypothetical protein